MELGSGPVDAPVVTPVVTPVEAPPAEHAGTVAEPVVAAPYDPAAAVAAVPEVKKRSRSRERERRQSRSRDKKTKSDRGSKAEPRGHPIKSASGWAVMVSHLNGDETETALRDRFSVFGTVGRIFVNRSLRSGHATSAFLEFEVATEAEAAIASCGGHGGFAVVDKAE